MSMIAVLLHGILGIRSFQRIVLEEVAMLVCVTVSGKKRLNKNKERRQTHCAIYCAIKTKCYILMLAFMDKSKEVVLSTKYHINIAVSL